MRLTFVQRLALAGIPPQPTRVVIHLRDSSAGGLLRDLESQAESSLGPLWEAIRQASGGVAIHGALREFSAEAFAELMRRVRVADPDLPPHADLSLYRTIEVPADHEASPLLRLLRDFEPGMSHYVASLSAPPPAGDQPPAEPLRSTQGYQGPAPLGIDAEYAWSVPGGDGAFNPVLVPGPDQGRVHIVDIEQGWVLNHQDLPIGGFAIPLLSGLNIAARGHGTAVLGVLAALDNTVQCFGTVAGARVKVASEWRPRPSPLTPVRDLVAAIADLLPGGGHPLPAGSILLLESQVEHSIESSAVTVELPVDYEPLNNAIIRTASTCGMIVIEAAGNGGVDLDTVPPLAINPATLGSWPDSKAIVVSGARPGAAPLRVGNKNWGTRVHCFAWGETVGTLGDDDFDESVAGDRDDFNGTSSAAAIVAAAAASLQGMMITDIGQPETPDVMRALLSDPGTGTPSFTPVKDKIGVMPNLRLIAEQRTRLVDDVVMCAILGDNGQVRPHAFFESPDIIPRHVVPPDPELALSEDDVPHQAWNLERPSRLFVRARNLGGKDSGPVRFTVYRTPFTSIPMRREWRFLGSTHVPNIPHDGSRKVAPAIVCPEVPESERDCAGLVAIVQSKQDCPPDLSDLDDLETLRYRVRYCNNVAFRMFHEVPFPRPSAKQPRIVPFMVCGPVLEDASMDLILEVEGEPLAMDRVVLGLPTSLVEALDGMWPMVDATNGAFLEIAPHLIKPRRMIAREVPLARHAVHTCAWILQPGAGAGLLDSEIKVRLRTRYREIVVGELIWRFT